MLWPLERLTVTVTVASPRLTPQARPSSARTTASLLEVQLVEATLTPAGSSWEML